MKGILFIALQHHYYGKMAASLAATLKAIDPEMPITLICDRASLSELSEHELKLFNKVDQLISPLPLRAKLLLPELSPYDETIYLDVDMAWLGRSVNEIFDQCQGHDFVIKNYSNQILSQSVTDENAWANYADIALVYKLGEKKNYHISSEIIYFKKTKEVKKLFKSAIKFFDNPKVNYKSFAGYIADELALNIAMMQNDYYPGIDNWNPVLWRQENKGFKFSPENVREHYYALSMGGIRSTSEEMQFYNNLIAAAYYKIGINNPYRWVDKYRYLTVRKTERA